MILNILKPQFITSYDCIRMLKYLFRHPDQFTDDKTWSKISAQYQGGKIGHAGTLDPFAEGVLVICTDKDTKKIPEIQSQPKEYQALVKLGQVSDTYDVEGKITKTAKNLEKPDKTNVEKILKSHFTGEIMQTPPAFSAKKIKGKRAYQLASAGKRVKLAPKKVIIYNIGVNKYGYPDLELTIECGSGTYIRSIAHDLGKILKTGGYCHSLTRTRVGEYQIENSITLPEVLIKQYQEKYRTRKKSKLKTENCRTDVPSEHL